MSALLSHVLPPLVPIFTPHSWMSVRDMVKIIRVDRLVVLDINDINILSAFGGDMGIENVLVSVVSSRYGFYELITVNPAALADEVLRAASLGSHGAQSLMLAHQDEGLEQRAAPAWGAIQWLRQGGVPEDIKIRLSKANGIISSRETVFLPFENTTMLLDAKYGELIVVNFKSWRDALSLLGLFKTATSRGAWVLLSSPGHPPKKILQDVCVKSCKRVLLQDGRTVRQGVGMLLG